MKGSHFCRTTSSSKMISNPDFHSIVKLYSISSSDSGSEKADSIKAKLFRKRWCLLLPGSPGDNRFAMESRGDRALGEGDLLEGDFGELCLGEPRVGEACVAGLSTSTSS